MVTLPGAGAQVSRVAVSPDGRLLALSIRGVPLAGRPSDQLRVSVVGTDGTGYREIFGPATVLPQAGGLHWTADGRIVFGATTAEGRLRVMSISASGGGPVFTGVEIAQPFRFDRLQDGSIFISRPSGNGRFGIMRIGATGGPAEFTGVEVDQPGGFTVSPDGSRVVVELSSDTADDELWALDLRSLTTRR